MAKAAVDNAILAHRLCNRLDHSLRVGRSHRSDLERIRKAREEGIRRNNVLTGNTEGGEIPTVEATGEPSKETEPVAEAATLSRCRRRRRRNGRRCGTPRRRSTSSPTRRSLIAPGRTSLGSRARSATHSSIGSWDLATFYGRIGPGGRTQGRAASRTPRTLPTTRPAFTLRLVDGVG
jgi:hypothetical protein